MAQNSTGISTEQQQSKEYLFKVIITGDKATGKTCLLRSFVRDEFSEKYVTTTGVDFMAKEITKEDKTVKLQIWDRGGHER